MRSLYQPGHTFPDFVLPDHTKTKRRLSALQGDVPMLLVLVRGFSCPKDFEQLKALTRLDDQLDGESGRLVVITSDDWLSATALRRQLGAGYPFLCDDAQQVRARLGMLEPDASARRPMVPHTFLLAPRLRICRVWNGQYYWGRPSNAELSDALRDITHEPGTAGDRTARRPSWTAAGADRRARPYGPARPI